MRIIGWVNVLCQFKMKDIHPPARYEVPAGMFTSSVLCYADRMSVSTAPPMMVLTLSSLGFVMRLFREQQCFVCRDRIPVD